MKTPVEIRNKAWQMLWRSKWLSRFVFLIVAFGFIRYVAVNISVSLLGSAVESINERLLAATTPEAVLTLLRDPAFLKALLLMMALAFFVATVIDGIASYGMARVRLEVAAGKEPQKWQRLGFSGFRDPFGMFALAFMHGLFVWWPVQFVAIPALVCLAGGLYYSGTFSPFCLAALPFAALSIVMFYRYRQAWFLKARHADWSALKCLRESAKMMKGLKWRNFALDCAFWRPIALQMSVMFCATLLAVTGASPMLTMCTALLITALNLYLNAYIPLGQAIFHLQMAKHHETTHEEIHEDRRNQGEGGGIETADRTQDA